MKRLYQGLTVIAIAALTACSSMEINDVEAVAENYPSDFDAKVYLELHPVLLTLQILNYVSAENDVYKSSMSAEAYAAKVTEDSLAFVRDTASVHRFFVSPRYAAYSEEKWDSVWIEKQDTIVTPIDINKVVRVTLDTLDSAGATTGSQLIYVDSLVLDTTGLICEIFGKLDTAATEVSKIEVDNVTTKVNNKLTKTEKVGTRDSVYVKITPPGLDSLSLVYILPYNLYGVSKDIDVLNAFESDLEAAARQFLAFGRSHGWAYRRCSAEEKSHKAVDPVYNPVNYPATKLYCDDDGVAREI